MINFNQFKNILLRRKKKVEKDIKTLKEDDPVLSDNAAAESSEPGTDSWLADTHSRAVAMRRNLEGLLSGIKKSLMALKLGKYGKCESCGKMIEEGRLKAMPTATLCIACSKKATSKK